MRNTIREGLDIGPVYEALGVEPSWYLAGCVCYIENILQRARNVGESFNKDQFCGMYLTLTKKVLLDVALVWETFYHERKQRIRDTYKALETDHNLCLRMIEQCDREIKKLPKRREEHLENESGG